MHIICNVNIEVFWDVRQCRLVDTYGRFKGTPILRNVGNYLPVDRLNISKDLNPLQYFCKNLESRSA
jgi:hypothetical protein